MSPRIAAAAPPFPARIEAILAGILPPGMPPLVLLTTLAREPRLFEKFFAANLLDRGRLSVRQRELVILRTTARGGSEYEWGIHVTLFGARAGFDAAQLESIVHGDADDPCWDSSDRPLLRLADALHASCDIDDALWRELAETGCGDEARLELLMLAGFYRTVAYLTNALRLPLEPAMERFPQPRAACTTAPLAARQS